MDYKSIYSLENNYKLNPHWPILITYTMGFSVVERAEELNVIRILTGQGGDHILAGNLYVLHEYFRTFQWVQLYREAKALPNLKRFIKVYLIAPLIGEKNIRYLRTVYHKIKRKKPLKKIPEIDFHELSNFYNGHSVAFKYDLEQLLHSTFSALMDSSYYSVAEEHFGIEFKHPFFDRRLIEFMLSLPPKFKYSEGISKRLLRTAMKGILPEKIRQRTDKAEFSEVLRQQIDAIDLDELFHNANLARLGLVDQKKLDTYKEDYKSGKMKKVVYFWQLINLEYWYRFNFVNDHNMDR
jgi:asparagine synthase (glutamine-hydrolysing)